MEVAELDFSDESTMQDRGFYFGNNFNVIKDSSLNISKNIMKYQDSSSDGEDYEEEDINDDGQHSFQIYDDHEEEDGIAFID